MDHPVVGCERGRGKEVEGVRYAWNVVSVHLLNCLRVRR